MGRVEQGDTRPPSRGHGAQRHRKQLTDSAKPSYKVILEEVTQTRKPLKLEDYHSIDPPGGYKFVPAGDPTLTTKCKELARLDGKLVYAVTTIDKNHTELSKQVHRVGFHFPAEVVQRALTSLGIDLDQEDDVLRKHEVWPKDDQKRVKRQRNIKNANPLKKNGKSQLSKGLNIQEMTQEEVDAQAKAAILDMFPAMPHENLYQIILHAFELGTDRVGVQLNDLSLPRRVQLAVVAHIRHVYTQYDSLLQLYGWSGARARVASKTLEVLASWRGDKDDDLDVVEDILREVIVISDDEDEPQQMTPLPVSLSQHTFGARHKQNNVPVTSYESLPHPVDSGRSNKQGTRRQMWLDVREKRKAPMPLPQARNNHSYYIPYAGRDPPMDVDQKSYERRLRGLESHSQQWIDSKPEVRANDSNPKLFGGYDQSQLSTPVRMDQYNRPFQLRQFNNGHQLAQSPQSSNIESKGRSEHDMRTPRQGETSLRGKLELVPITDDILPSIETPRTERGAASAFTRGAIHIDSPPPPDFKPEYSHLMRGPDNPSPVKRKREVSPMSGMGSNHKQIVYLPIREVQSRMDPQARDYERFPYVEHEQSQSSNNKVVYLPLDQNNNVQSHRPQNRGYVSNRMDAQQVAAQIYLDSPQRLHRYQPRPDQGLEYQYLPIGPLVQRRDPDIRLDDPDRSGTRLIPLSDYRETFSSHRPNDDWHPSRSTVLLDAPGLQYRQGYDEVRSDRRVMIPLQPTTEPLRQIRLDDYQQRHQGALPRAENQTSRHQPVQYSPHDPTAGLSHVSPNTQHHHQERGRKDSRLG